MSLRPLHQVRCLKDQIHPASLVMDLLKKPWMITGWKIWIFVRPLHQVRCLRPETSPSISGDRSTEEAVDDVNNLEEMDLRQPKNTLSWSPFKCVVCYYCGEAGHIQSRCPKRKLIVPPKAGQLVKGPEVQGLSENPSSVAEGDTSKVALLVEQPESNISLEWCKAFFHQGIIDINGESYPVTVSCDTGAQQSVCRIVTGKPVKSGQHVLCHGINSEEYHD
ncbi:hypothetical protein Pcinc_009365 [Petrolisthes cinctipes]|uniref:CCHC-type domain-containing protein n=1 Tax=Petrolisthes cinctipes TaxID=88211 RepID=A0AAE1KYK5_PETCI|nr:hypothetical protein Pcinc_009365 [Petrolisthes cinctipes]